MNCTLCVHVFISLWVSSANQYPFDVIQKPTTFYNLQSSGVGSNLATIEVECCSFFGPIQVVQAVCVAIELADVVVNFLIYHVWHVIRAAAAASASATIE